MGTLFSMPGGAAGEAAYNTLTLVTGSGQAQAWNNTPQLNGIEGDVTFTCNNTNSVRASAVDLDFTTAPALWATGWFDASGMTFTGNALFGICVVSLPSSTTADLRIGIAYRYTHTGTVHKLFCRTTNDAASSSVDTEVDLTLAPHKFDFRLQKASTVSANDGVADFYLDDALVTHQTGLDVFTDFAALEWFQFGGTGKISGLDAGALGPLHMGKLAINDTGDPIVFSASTFPCLTYLRRRRRD